MIPALVELILQAICFGVVCTSIYVVAISITRFSGAEHKLDKTQPSYKRIKHQMDSLKSTQNKLKGY